jgi:hypothetical protein
MGSTYGADWAVKVELSVQHSSEPIGKIAEALAKAQAELENPEKSLTATIRSLFPREESRTFRYASLASGLEIVRKCLSKHAIAIVQATAIERETGLIKLTTALVHSSGERVSSDWPVCLVSETATPHRMGAALTYARRYALFTLVGIAGEDDLDAPDLFEGPPAATPADSNGSADKKTSNRSVHKPRLPKPLLAADASATLRDQLLTEIAELKDTEDLALWVHRRLPAKNTLAADDAQGVEAAFQVKLAALGNPDDPPGAAQISGDGQPAHPDPAAEKTTLALQEESGAGHGGMAAKTIRLRDKEHRKFVSNQPCIVCGRTPVDPHHLRFAQPRALGRKVSDEFVVPVCRLHHREVHRQGDEAAWWKKLNIDPMPVALRLWHQTGR